MRRLPESTATPNFLSTESKIKTLLSSQGFNEVYNNSLISLDLIEKAMLKEASHLKLNNALSKDYEYLRTTLVPSVLQNIKNNQGKTEEPFYLYELSNVYLPTGEKLPRENSMLVIGTTIPFRLTKSYLTLLFEHLSLKKYKFKTSTSSPIYFVEEKTATISSGDSTLGFIGSIKPAILHKLGITSDPIIIELDAQKLVDSISENYIYSPISDFPDVVEQITISSNERVGDIIEKIRSANKLIKDISYLDSFEKNHSFKITFSSPNKNLTQSEVNDIKCGCRFYPVGIYSKTMCF
ncbi:MAG: Phenylalanine-tRNA ligase beta subunit [Candidatus Collierbacteria bacterium GW2011_GWE2_42_48]|nr:MAG: Phenylalanine-tRNA ligase beta subunit [Candidatus Collierbacteria bacterium GW2011_GWE2_42_48]